MEHAPKLNAIEDRPGVPALRHEMWGSPNLGFGRLGVNSKQKPFHHPDHILRPSEHPIIIELGLWRPGTHVVRDIDTKQCS